MAGERAALVKAVRAANEACLKTLDSLTLKFAELGKGLSNVDCDPSLSDFGLPFMERTQYVNKVVIPEVNKMAEQAQAFNQSIENLNAYVAKNKNKFRKLIAVQKAKAFLKDAKAQIGALRGVLQDFHALNNYVLREYGKLETALEKVVRETPIPTR